MLGVLPPKYRRIFIALLVVVIILLIISWLKPDDNIEQYFEQSTGNSIPTQFQPLDHSQPVEPSILEQLKNPQPKVKISHRMIRKKICLYKRCR